jgi:hypothetical protein
MKSELNEIDLERQPPIRLLDFLEAENSRLRRAVIELSLDTLILRDALRRSGRPRNAA